jgi:hypothetical protein
MPVVVVVVVVGVVQSSVTWRHPGSVRWPSGGQQMLQTHVRPSAQSALSFWRLQRSPSLCWLQEKAAEATMNAAMRGRRTFTRAFLAESRALAYEGGCALFFASIASMKRPMYFAALVIEKIKER